jgi:chromosome segregation and condensation protein ScpB
VAVMVVIRHLTRLLLQRAAAAVAQKLSLRVMEVLAVVAIGI